MSRLGLLFFRVVMLLGALVSWAVFAVQQTPALVGTASVDDAYRRLTQQLPDWTDRLLSATWWVPALPAAVATLFLVWPFRARRSAAAPPAEAAAPAPTSRVEAERPPDAALFRETPKAASGKPYLKDQHIYAGSARLSMVPEFRAIPVRHISRARIFVEYSAYSTAFHLWEERKRILVAEIRDQEAGEWSVINVELMTSFDNEAGVRTWRWARELDYGPPEDEDYRFAIADHYQGRVVFEGPDGTAHHSYFAIMPSRDFPSDMPNLISQGIFDFVQEWESEDLILTI